MSASTLAIPKAYRDGLAWTEAIADGFKAAIETWGADTVDNINQLRLDVFGSSYSLDNDGAANNSTAMNVSQTITPTATISAIDIVSTALTTGSALDISDADALTTGTLVNIKSNSADTSTRALLKVTNDNSLATGAECISVQQDADAYGIYVTHTLASGNSAAIRAASDNPAFTIYASSTTASAGGLYSESTHATYTGETLFLVATRAATSSYSFIKAQSSGGADTEFWVKGDGTLLSDIAGATPADYAEMFECANSKGMEPGYFVTLDGTTSKIRPATDKDSYILGVVSGNPAFIGDSGWARWEGKYLKDEFGRYLLDENGHRLLNPKFDATQTYKPRSDRPEWVPVGMVGKLNVRTSKAVTGEFVDVGPHGFAVPGKTYRVVEEIMPYSASKKYGVVKIIFRGKE